MAIRDSLESTPQSAHRTSSRVRLHARVLVVVLTLKLVSLASFYLGFSPERFAENFGGFVNSENSRASVALRRVKNSPVRRLAYYDGQWYLDIAENGYSLREHTRRGQRNIAFFPAFPFMLRSFSLIGISPLIGGIAANQLLSVLAGVFFFHFAFRVCRHSSGALSATALLFMYPSAGAFNILYAESLFLCLLCAHLLLTEKGQFKTAGMVGVLLGLCRPQGVLAAFYHMGSLWHDGSRTRRWSRVWALAGPIVGFCAFWIYLSLLTGSWSSLFTVQRSWGRHGSIGGISAEFEKVSGSLIGWLVVSVVVVFVAGLPWRVHSKHRWDFFLYSVACLVIPLSTGSITSLPRFLLANVPQYIGVACVLRGLPGLQVIALSFLALLQGAANAHIMQWQWVF